jgi:hypothetical protein
LLRWSISRPPPIINPPIGFLNPAIYAIGQGPAYSSAFHDVTSGNNTNAANPARFFAVAGYDLCTGWGSPTGSNLVNALLAPPDALQISPGSNQIASGVAGGPFGPAFRGFSLTNAGLKSLSWTLGTTSTWLRFSASAGALAPKSPATNVDVLLAAETTTFLPGSYSAEIWFTNLNNGFSQSRRLTLNVVTPPVITVAPADQSVPAGAPAQFSVQTLSNAMLSFQWKAHGSNLLDTPNISGSSTPSLRLNHVALSDGGSYSVLVSNVAGSALTPAALLVVTSSPPIIVAQPMGQTVLPGAGAIFTVSAYGDSPVTYRWRANGSDLVDGPNLSGATSNTLALLSASAHDAAPILSSFLMVLVRSRAPTPSCTLSH